MRLIRLAIFVSALHWLPCQGASPSVSVVNLPLGGTAMAQDHAGSIFLTGVATGSFAVTPGAAQVQPGGAGMCVQNLPLIGAQPVPCPDTFVAKVEPSTGAVVYATYLGGDTNDIGAGIAIDSAGNAYVTGLTGGDFPTTPAALLPAANSGVFVAKLSPDGSHFIYSTYLPGTTGPGPLIGSDLLNPLAPAIAVDSQGNAYVTGQTTAGQAFVAKLSADGTALLYNTILPGGAGTAIAVDAVGNAYVTGIAESPDFPVSAGAFQTRLAGVTNAFLTKLDRTGKVVFATFLGGSGSDRGVAVQADSSGNIYVAGATTSLDFPTTSGSYEPKAVVPLWAREPGSGFAAKLSPGGDKLLYSSYIAGGSYNDNGSLAVTGMTVDSTGGAYLAGVSGAGFAIPATAPQPCLAGESDVVVIHLNSQGALVDRTYFGGTGADTLIGMGLPGDHSVQLAANFDGAQPVFAQLHFGDASDPAAPCLSPAVANAASFFTLLGPGTGVAPGEIISLSGFGMGPEEAMSMHLGPDGSAPVELGGVQVFFDDTPVPLLYVQSQQINAFAPFELAGRSSTTVRVVYRGETIGSFSQTVLPATPAVFRWNPGSTTQAAAINQDGTINGPAHPAPVGSIVSLYGTGFGQTKLPGVTGSIFPAVPSLLEHPVEVYVGGSYCPPGTWVCSGGFLSNVLYAGAAPLEFAGVDQINFRIPPLNGLTGDAVQVTVASVLSPPVDGGGFSALFGAVTSTIAVR